MIVYFLWDFLGILGEIIFFNTPIKGIWRFLFIEKISFLIAFIYLIFFAFVKLFLVITVTLNNF